MATPFVGEIRMFAGNFAPRDWAYCDGQLLAISQNDALFSLFGTIYGGDGRTTFGLPDLRGRIPIHLGQGPGLSQRNIGSKGGSEAVGLTGNEVPAHSHALRGNPGDGDAFSPTNRVPAKSKAGLAAYADNPEFISPTGAVNMHADTIGNAGGGQPHENMMPSLALHFIVALFGVYPSRA